MSTPQEQLQSMITAGTRNSHPHWPAQEGDVLSSLSPLLGEDMQGESVEWPAGTQGKVQAILGDGEIFVIEISQYNHVLDKNLPLGHLPLLPGQFGVVGEIV